MLVALAPDRTLIIDYAQPRRTHSHQPHSQLMYQVDGVSAVASITDLQAGADSILRCAENSPGGTVSGRQSIEQIAVPVSVDYQSQNKQGGVTGQ